MKKYTILASLALLMMTLGAVSPVGSINITQSDLEDLRSNLTDAYNHALAKNLTDNDLQHFDSFHTSVEIIGSWLRIGLVRASKEQVTSSEKEKIEDFKKGYNEFLEWIVYNKTNQDILENLKDQKEIYQSILKINGIVFLELGNYSAANDCISKAIELEYELESDERSLNTLWNDKAEALDGLDLSSEAEQARLTADEYLRAYGRDYDRYNRPMQISTSEAEQARSIADGYASSQGFNPSSSGVAKSSDSSSKVECMGNDDLEEVIAEALMQMGYFKSAHLVIEDKVAELTVEPSAQGYQEASSMKHILFLSIATMDQYSPCLRDKLNKAGIYIVGPEYDVLLTFPYSAALDGTSEQVYESENIQK